MLFRTVYGPELEAIYRFIAEANDSPSRPTIYATFLLQRSNDRPVSTQNVDDALSFLESVGLVRDAKRGGYHALGPFTDEPFRVKVLRQLRALELGLVEPVHPIDPLYGLLLTELFIRPNQLFVTDVHSEANKLRRVADVGGLSREKVQVWKRVMEFLGAGRRMLSGFMGVYSPSLVLEVLAQWPQTEGTLQSFLEEHFNRVLPFQTENGDLAHAVEQPLTYLESRGVISLTSLQDSPSKPYFGERRVKHIAYLEVADVVQ